MSRITLDQSQQLDSIRALSAFVVLFAHANQTLLAPTLSIGTKFLGLLAQLSVMVFFVLSGFLIGKSIFNNISKNSEFSIGQYAKDRALRIFPPLIAALILMAILSTLAPLLFPSGSNELLSIPGATFVRDEFLVLGKDIWSALAFLNNFRTNYPSKIELLNYLNSFKAYPPISNGPLWSLSIEVWYYVIAAAIFVWRKRKALSITLFTVTLLVTYTNLLFFWLAPVWFAGLALALIHQHKPAMNNKIFGCLFLALTIVVTITTLLLLYGESLGRWIWLDRMNHFRLASGLWFACFMALIMGGAARFPKTLHNHAGYSYTLYVIHFPIMLFTLGATQKFIYGSVTLSLTVFACAIVIALIAARYISRFAENKKLIHTTLSNAQEIFNQKISK